MDYSRIGVNVDDFRLSPKDALARAAQLEFRAVEMGIGAGELGPQNLSMSGRRHLLRYVQGLGMTLSAVSANLPGLHLLDPARSEERVERTRAVLEMAADMRVPIVTAEVAPLTDPQTGQPLPQAIEVLRQIAVDADRTGTIYAIRAADRAENLARVFDELRCPSLRICLDPAAMVMAGNDPSAVLTTSADQVVLSYARDGTAGSSNARGSNAGGSNAGGSNAEGSNAGGDKHGGVETPIGQGEVDIFGYVVLLEATGYHGPIILRRRDSQRPIEDLLQGRAFIKKALQSTG